MAKKITIYEKKVLPSGKSGEAPRPFQPAPPMMPIGAAGAKYGALSRLGGAGAELGFTLMRINAELEQHRQNVVAENEGNTFNQLQIDKQRAWEQRYPGSLATEETLGERYDELKDDAAEVLDRRTDLNDTTKVALGKLLNHHETKYRLNSSNYNQAQVRVVENDNIKADLARQIIDVEEGTKTVERAIELHALSFGNNNGREDLFYFNTIQIEEAGIAAKEDREITKAILKLSEDHIDDPMGAIKEASSPAFLKKHGIDVQEKVLASLVRAQVRIEKEQEMFAEQWRQKNQPKLRNVTLTYDDIKDSPLTGKEKRTWDEKLTKQIKALADGKKDPLTVTNNTIYGRISERISLNPKEVDIQKDIWDLQGNGLSTKNCETLAAKLKTNLTDPIRGDATKRYHGLLKSFKTNNIFSDDEKENAYIYAEKAAELDNFVATDPSDTELATFFKELTDEPKSSFLDWVIDKLFRLTPTPEVLTQALEARKKTVTKTGTVGGRKVVEYSDGTVEYAD